MMSRVKVSKRQSVRPKRGEKKIGKSKKAQSISGFDIVAEVIAEDAEDLVLEIADEIGKQEPEGGIHAHGLDRESKTTLLDGDHTHVFKLPDGTLISSEMDGQHAHQLMDEGMEQVWGGRHVHVVRLADGTELRTEADGEHGHELQVSSTALSGLHIHALALPGGAVIESLSPGQFFELMEERSAAAKLQKDLEKRIVERDGEFCAVSEDGSRSFGCYSTREQAAERLRQVEAAVAAQKNSTEFPEVLKAGSDMPLAGSGLPVSLEEIVPAEFRYWTKKSEEARAMRDALIYSGFFTEENVRVVDGQLRRVEMRMFLYEPEGDKAPEPFLTKFRESMNARLRKVRFAVSRQVWKSGRKAVHLILDDPRGGIETWTWDMDPHKLIGTVRYQKRAAKDLLTFAGEVAIGKKVGGEDVNGTKSIPSTFEMIDSGIASMVGASEMRKIRLNGEGIAKGDFALEIEEPGSEFWTMTERKVRRAEKGEALDFLLKRFGKVEDTDELVDMFEPVNAISESSMGEIRRRLAEDGEQRIAVGIVLEPEVQDAQDDIYSEEEVKRAATDYMKNHERLKLMHEGESINDRVTLLGSYITKESFSIGDETVAKGTWIAVLFVPDAELWSSLKSGALGGLSIGGSAIRRPA